MPYDYAASVQGVALRVTRLDGNGNLLNGKADSYTTAAFLRVSFTPEYEEGDEITEKAADGTVCVSFKAPDTLKRVNLEIAVCDPDPELSALLSGGLMLSGDVGTNVQTGQPGKEQVVGWASAQVGEDPSGNGVAVEVWSRAIQNGKPAGINPFFRWVFPYVKTRLSGDRVIENGLLATTFEGFGLGNINFRSGIDESWRWPAATDRPYLYAREGWAPTGLRGFYTWTKTPDPLDPTKNQGHGAAVPDDLADPADPDFVATNVPGAGNPYPYDNSLELDFILSEDDYKAGPAGGAQWPASAAMQDVTNTAPADAAQNTVTYLARGSAVQGAQHSIIPGGHVGNPAAAAPGDTFPAEKTITASDATSAGKLAGLGFVANPTTAWTVGQAIAVGPFEFSWNGTAWVAGAGAAPVTLTAVAAGTPGGFGPAGVVAPANLAALKQDTVVGDTANAAAHTDPAWRSGQYVVLADATEAYWDGTAWQTGKAP